MNLSYDMIIFTFNKLYQQKKSKNVPFLLNSVIVDRKISQAFRSSDKYNSNVIYLARNFKSFQKISVCSSLLLVSQVSPTSKGPFFKGRPSFVAWQLDALVLCIVKIF